MTLLRFAAHNARGQRGWHTPLCGDDSDIMPLLLLTVQLHHCAYEARVGGDAEQSLWVWLGIDGVPEVQKQCVSKNRMEKDSKERPERASERATKVMV